MQFSESLLSQTMTPLTGSAIRAIFHLLGKPGMISFAGGNPAMSALEPDVIAQLAHQVLDSFGANLLQYGATEGLPALREQIVEFVKSASIETEAARVLPTQGSQQALDLLLKVLVNPGDVVLCESPTFLGAIQGMRTYGAKVVGLPMDEQGVMVDAVEQAIIQHKPKLIYLIPTFQNPSGKTLPLERRAALAALACKYGVILAEDDPYRDLRYEGTPLPSIKSFDEEGWVVYMGSFSKLISPGLRVGYAIVDFPALLRKMTIAKQSVDVHSPLLSQAIVSLYLSEGRMPEHLARITKNYKAQLGRMIDGFAHWPRGVRYTRPEGGLFVWAELPEGMNTVELLTEATERGVAYVPGTHFFAEGGRLNTLRLNFSNSELPQIETGMKALGQLIGEKKA